MDTAWIQIFILTLAECVAPAGKTVCQEQQFELRFVTKADCEYALEQMLAMKEGIDTVIIDRSRTRCHSTAMEASVFSSLDEVNAANADTVGWQAASPIDARRRSVDEDYQERLGNLMPCEETSYVVPCRVGDIIVEDEPDGSVEVWRQD